MWFYLGIFTTVIATIVRLQQKLSLKSELQNRPTNLIPVHGKYKYEWSPANEKAPSFGYLELACKTSIQFAARREHWFDRLSKQIGLAYECQTGHDDFDQHVYLTGITEDDADFIGQHAQLPKKILAILSNHKRDSFIHPGNQLICDGEHLFLKIVNTDKEGNTQEAFIGEKLELLRQLALALQEKPLASPHFWKVPSQRNTAIILAISSTIAVLGGLEFFRFIIFRDNQLLSPLMMIPTAITIALIGAGLMIGFVLSYVKASARRHLILAEVCIIGFSGLAFASYGWLYDLNMRLQPQTASYQDVVVTNKYKIHHSGRRRNYDTYHLSLYPATPPLNSELSVSLNEYIRAEQGKHLRISIESGYFGYSWLRSIKKN
jgi:hypothetical protein